MSIDQAFNASVDYYDDWMKKALPNYADIFRTAQEIIPFEPDTALNVLDLGAGTGIFSKHVLDRYPKAKFVLVDVAEKMLNVARARFQNQPGQFEYVSADYRELNLSQDFDLVISSLSIHHLSDAEKRGLFFKVYRQLRSPGLFINVDQIRGETPYLRGLYWDTWLKRVRQVEPSEERIQASIQRRTTYDQDALLADQLSWLKEAGFSNVDCVYKNYFIGVFLGVKE